MWRYTPTSREGGELTLIFTEPLDLVKTFPEDFAEDCGAEPLPDEGEVFGASEFAGATFSPDGQWLFVNIQYPGITIAITGPWEQGAVGA